MTDGGMLVLTPESGLEAFALQCWSDRVDWVLAEKSGIRITALVAFDEASKQPCISLTTKGAA
jgi:hypothetical protein